VNIMARSDSPQAVRVAAASARRALVAARFRVSRLNKACMLVKARYHRLRKKHDSKPAARWRGASRHAITALAKSASAAGTACGAHCGRPLSSVSSRVIIFTWRLWRKAVVAAWRVCATSC